MKSYKGSAWLALILLLVTAQSIAHEVHVFATTNGQVVNGRVYYAGDEPAVGVEVAVLTGEGAPLGLTETDSEGRFQYDGAGQESLQFVVETDGGHRAEFTIALGQEESEEVVKVSDVAASVEIQQLAEQLDSLEHRLRLQDILGGIGYIVGVMGLIAFWKARSGQRQS